MAGNDNDISGLPQEKESKKASEGIEEGVLLKAIPTTVDIHPLILLSAVDHFSRMNNKVNTNRRCVGLLLGMYLKDKKAGESRIPASAATKGKSTVLEDVMLDINNCFAVPFTEDPKDNAVWFFDTNYAEEMFRMYKKVLPKVRIVGWYSTGTEIQPNDLLIHLLLCERFCPNPVYCVINTDPTNKGLPVMAYMATEGREGRDVEFRNIVTSLGSYEAEEIGIEHLLRDLTDSTITTLSTKVQDRHLALLKLEALLGSVGDYLTDVADGSMPVQHDILATIQEVVDLLPLLNQMKTATGAIVAANDQALGTFIGSVSRCVMALYDVILNRRRLAQELKEKQAEEKAKQEKEKEAKEKPTQKDDADNKNDKKDEGTSSGVAANAKKESN